MGWEDPSLVKGGEGGVKRGAACQVTYYHCYNRELSTGMIAIWDENDNKAIK